MVLLVVLLLLLLLLLPPSHLRVERGLLLPSIRESAKSRTGIGPWYRVPSREWAGLAPQPCPTGRPAGVCGTRFHRKPELPQTMAHTDYATWNQYRPVCFPIDALSRPVFWMKKQSGNHTAWSRPSVSHSLAFLIEQIGVLWEMRSLCA